MSLSTVEFLMLSDPEEMDNVFFFFFGKQTRNPGNGCAQRMNLYPANGCAQRM